MTRVSLAAVEAFAVSRCGDQSDLTGRPYHRHLRAVAERAARRGGDDIAVAAAWLHDTVEDGHATLEEIEAHFGVDIVRVVDVLTKRPEETYAAFIERIGVTAEQDVRRRAVVVKLADLSDNLDADRVALLAAIDPGKAISLCRRYVRAVEMLTILDISSPHA